MKEKKSNWRVGSYANWAYLDDLDVPVLCNRKKSNEWFWADGAKRCETRLDELKVSGTEWGINTRFQRFCTEPDGPLVFWKVTVWSYVGDYQHYRSGEKLFGTKDEALRYHEIILNTIRKLGVVPPSQLELKSPFDEEDNRDEADWWKEEAA